MKRATTRRKGHWYPPTTDKVCDKCSYYASGTIYRVVTGPRVNHLAEQNSERTFCWTEIHYLEPLPF